MKLRLIMHRRHCIKAFNVSHLHFRQSFAFIKMRNAKEDETIHSPYYLAT